MNTNKELRLLVVEDNVRDAELMIRELRRAGWTPQCRRVDKGPDFLAELEHAPDLILSDYNMPSFDGLLALQWVRERGLDIPFILVSGTVGEEAAVEAMKRGANDYLLKDRIARLGPIVERVLEEKRLREERRRAEEELRLAHEQLHQLLAHSPAVIYTVQLLGDKIIPVLVSDNIHRLLGVSPQEATSFEWWQESLHPEDRARVVTLAVKAFQESGYSAEYRIRHQDGSFRWVEDKNRVVRDSSGRRTQAVGVWIDITERKRLEEEVVLRERRLASFFTGATAGLAMLDTQLRYVHVNDTLAKMNGIAAAAHLGRTVRQVLPELAPTIEPYVRRVVVEGESVLNVEFSGETPAQPGVERHWNGSYFPIAGPDHSTGGVGAIVAEITERKRAEQELRFRNAILSTQQEVSLDGILVVDQHGKVVSYNRRFVEMWGIPPELVASQEDGALIRFAVSKVADPDAFLRRVQYLYEHRRETSREEIIHRAGRVFDRYSAPMFGVDEQYYGRVWYFRDITERKRAEERLKEQAALLDSANDAIYVHDFEDTVLYWNRGAERLYGWESREVVGHKIPDLLRQASGASSEPRRLLLEQDAWSGELTQTTKTGKSLTVFSRWTLLRDEQKQPIRILAINADLSEKKLLEAKFLRAQRLEAVGALASGIAHDLNNILAPVLMAAPLLRSEVKHADSRAMLDTIESCAQRGADIIKQLLTFARGEGGPRVLLALRHLLRDLQKIIRETFPRDIRSQVEIHKDLWPVIGDATQIHQALMNLCVNARDAMPEGGKLTIEAKNMIVDELFAAMVQDAKAGPYVSVRITDTGTGIAPEILDKVFEPFFTTKGPGKGTGLGLATVLGILRGHQGFIRVDSRVGRGTTFELYFPAAREAVTAPIMRREAALPRGQGELILVVDDEAALRESLCRLLQAYGYQVIVAADGAAGLAAFSQSREKVQVVLTDMMMPLMNGPAMIHALRSLDPSLSILGMSGLLELQGGKGLEQVELSAVLAKPFTASELLRVLRAALDVSGTRPASRGPE